MYQLEINAIQYVFPSGDPLVSVAVQTAIRTSLLGDLTCMYVSLLVRKSQIETSKLLQ